jgi:hypothetical protein
METADWIDSYAKAWETGDDELVGSLFTEDASYRSSPFREPYRGLEEIRAYWRRGAVRQRETRVQMGSPFGQGEWGLQEPFAGWGT